MCSFVVMVWVMVVVIWVLVFNGRWGLCCLVDFSGIIIDGDVFGSWFDVVFLSFLIIGIC